MKGSRALFVSSLLLIAASGIVMARSSPVGSPHAPKLLPFIIGPAPFAGINLPGLLPPGISPECKVPLWNVQKCVSKTAGPFHTLVYGPVIGGCCSTYVRVQDHCWRQWRVFYPFDLHFPRRFNIYCLHARKN
ncbi:hypothetical protein NC652_020981 [Populus alba x Populus x berolinensis]|nr:hypothetical protein NC652_020981 [Populus alba x Populus x berolinensis]